MPSALLATVAALTLGANVSLSAQPSSALVARPKLPLPVEVRSEPAGPVVARLRGATEFGSPLAFSVDRRSGRWVAVRTAAVPNGRIGWIDTAKTPLRFARTTLGIDVDLSRRLLVLRRGEVVLRRAVVATGRAGSPTPTGRFAVTDKLPGNRYGSYYGCCILALSGTQPNVPAGWKGGNRLAIHGGPAGSIGKRASAGCLRASPDDLGALMRLVPLGTPVTIRD
ncbi:MAG: L,D-transpeptidase family protein [Thermoleophilia bacterium]|nr:L,D-transpeptidase family protein [Thermoleophilia bacterium]